MSKKTLVLILSTVLVGATTCRRQEASKYKDFFDLPLAGQLQEFNKYPLDKQLDVYLYDWNYKHPSKEGFAYTIAENGKSAVPFLLTRLDAEQNENSQDAIIHIFEIMFERGVLPAREDVLIATQRVVSDMKEPDIKQLSQERLTKMKGQSVGS